MPSIRLTPLQPTTFDLWRERVLTAPRRALIQEAAVDRDDTTGTFETLADRLVGVNNSRSLSDELSGLVTVLKSLLADERTGLPVGIGQSAADIRQALSAEGTVTTAINACADAITDLEPEEPAPGPADPGVPSMPGLPDDGGMTILQSLDLLREPLMDFTLSADDVNERLQAWKALAITGNALALLGQLGDRWQHLFLALAEAFPGDADHAIEEEERRKRLSHLVALEFDVSHALFDGSIVFLNAPVEAMSVAAPELAMAAPGESAPSAAGAASAALPQSSRRASKPTRKGAGTASARGGGAGRRGGR